MSEEVTAFYVGCFQRVPWCFMLWHDELLLLGGELAVQRFEHPVCDGGFTLFSILILYIYYTLYCIFYTFSFTMYSIKIRQKRHSAHLK